MDLLADENVPRPIIERLRMDGFAVRSVFEESAGIDDTHVLSLADEAGLILITQDQDFGELAILQRLPVAGVLLLELARLPLREQVERFASVLATGSADLSASSLSSSRREFARETYPGPRGSKGHSSLPEAP